MWRTKVRNWWNRQGRPKPQDYPQWYVALRTFMFGMVVGAELIAWVQKYGVTTDSTLATWLLRWSFCVGVSVLVGIFELAFAIIRHRRLARDLDGARSLHA